MFTRFFAVILVLFLSETAFAGYPSVSGCPALSDQSFRTTKIFDVTQGLNEPIQLAMDVNNAGDVDVYVTERHGAVKKVDGTSGQKSTLMTLSGDYLSTEFEDGLTGIVLDPDFDNNGWIYLFYSRKSPAWTFRIGRFTYNGTTMDVNAETLIIDVPRTNGPRLHTAGAMQFDSYGDLWFSVGDNDANAQGPGCTSDLRGDIIRIHPKPEGGYTIPEDNFGEYWSKKFRAAGNTSLADQYLNPALVKPEIFVKGTRNAYNMNVHPTKRWVGWAECGPDHGAVTEEHNIAAAPNFFGYPFWSGNQYSRGGGGNVDAPSNPECGAATLPPAIPGTHSYQQACAMGSQMYVYDQTLTNSTRFPPNFHEKWFMGDFNNDYLDWVTASVTNVTRAGFQIPVIQVSNPERFTGSYPNFLDAEFGPDGVLYVNNYAGWFNTSGNTAIVKVEYIGPEPSAECIQNALGADYVAKPGTREAAGPSGISFSGMSVHIFLDGPHTITIRNMSGKTVKTLSGATESLYDLSSAVKPGLYAVTAETQSGKVSKRLTVF